LKDGKSYEGEAVNSLKFAMVKAQAPWAGKSVPIFNLHPDDISGVEKILPTATVEATGRGTTQVLDILKNGDREDLFDAIETHFRRYVPEVEKLSLRTVKEGLKQIQVREKGLKAPTPGHELSEGTRLILAILTIIHQESPPPIILLEDIDRGMHPRLFEYIAPLMKDIAVRTGVNILATTHNPYLVDAFQEDRNAVIIVEKKDGASTLSTLEQRLEGLNYDEEIDPEDMPLGQLWFSGLVGGTPTKISHLAKP
jgi:predicted ATPase